MTLTEKDTTAMNTIVMQKISTVPITPVTIQINMRKIKIGDKVSARLFSGKVVTGNVESIEICGRDSKYGRSVTSCDLSKHSDGVIDLDCGSWCYFNQVKKIN